MATSDGSKKRRGLRARPVLQPLEERALLTALTVQGVDHQFLYKTQTGANVAVTLYGVGSLAGTSVNASGALNLVISGTNEQTGVIAKVKGGGGVAPLQSIEYGGKSAPSPDSLSGVGGTLINVVNLKNFDLVSGGKINLTAGVHTLFLNSVGPDTQINLRELPESLSNAGSSTSKAVVLGSGLTVGTGTYAMNGQTVTYNTSINGGVQTVTGVSGAFTAGSNLPPITSGSTANPLVQPAPLGLVLTITHVNGPAIPVGGLGDPQSFAYDPTANSLIRFDMTTGKPTMTIPNALPSANPQAGVTLVRSGGSYLVLIDNGQNVYAYDANHGGAVGSFSLSGSGLPNPIRIGTADATTVIADPTANGTGTIQTINLAKSLAAGQVVTLGSPYASQNGFGLSGGLSGVNGTDTLYAVGGATFDRYLPVQNQLGLTALSVGPRTGSISENTRGAFTTQGNAINANTPSGANASSFNNAVGSVDQSLAVITVYKPGQSNTVTLFNPTSLASLGTVSLLDGDRLSALTASFRPTLAGAALIDIQGNVQSFHSKSTQGLVLNDSGNLNLAQINAAADTTIAAYPFSHAEIPIRSNVSILSSNRIVAGRNGVSTTLGSPTGPLSLPDRVEKK